MSGILTSQPRNKTSKPAQLGYLLGDNVVPGGPRCEAPVKEKGQALTG